MIPLRVVRAPKPGSSYYEPSPGDMWRCRNPLHLIMVGRSPCWIIRLPGTAYVWHTNGKSTRTGQLWAVWGEAPALTVHPSVNVEGHWHGWITNGELSEA